MAISSTIIPNHNPTATQPPTQQSTSPNIRTRTDEIDLYFVCVSIFHPSAPPCLYVRPEVPHHNNHQIVERTWRANNGRHIYTPRRGGRSRGACDERRVVEEDKLTGVSCPSLERACGIVCGEDTEALEPAHSS